MTPKKIGRNELCPCLSGKKYKQCCALQNEKAASHNNGSQIVPLQKATAAFQAGNMQVAIGICQDILRLDPKHSAALNLLGILAYYSGNSEAAVQLLHRSILSSPNYPDAHNNLGEVYRSSGNVDRAIFHLQKALSINPVYIDALINYGNLLQDIYKFNEALDLYQKVITIQPRHTGALSNSANLLQQLNRHSEAAVIYKRLIGIDPNYDWALGGLVYAKLNCCDWTDLASSIEQINVAVKLGKRVVKPFDFITISNSAEMQLECSKLFSQYQNPSQSDDYVNQFNTKRNRLRVAYVSADYKQHPVAQLLVNVIEAHDRSRFEIIGISLGVDDKSPIRDRIVSAFDEFYDVRRKSDKDIADFIKGLNVDIAIDLMGHTAGARTSIFSYRSAPIQVNFLGYCGTSGADYFDYIIADEVSIPISHESYYSEKVVRLPNTFLPHDSRLEISTNLITRSMVGLPEDGFVFCAFNNPYKISRVFFEIWMRLLASVEDSVLWLSKANEVVKANLSRAANSYGISPDRLIFAERTDSLGDHLARHRLADLFLDTLPYNAHTTASDALWAGLPVLTCLGNTFNGRVAASLLNSVGMPELIVQTLVEYEAYALRLARDPKHLKDIKDKLKRNIVSYPIFDNNKYVSDLEGAFCLMVNEINSE